MSARKLYSDGLITIWDGAVTFHGYSFPLGKDKTVSMDRMRCVRVRRPTFWSGRWRIHGTGDFRTWFPGDAGRPSGDRIFIAHLKGCWLRVGFTAEDSDTVISILQDRLLMKFEPGMELQSIDSTSRNY